jgi:hypothetical protein
MNAKKLLVALSAGFVCLGGVTSANAASIAINDAVSANVDIAIEAPAAVSHSLTQMNGVMLTSSLATGAIVAKGSVKSINGDTLMAVSIDKQNVTDTPQCTDIAMKDDPSSKLRVCLGDMNNLVKHQDLAKGTAWYQINKTPASNAEYVMELAGGQTFTSVKPGIYNLSMSAAAFVM